MPSTSKKVRTVVECKTTVKNGKRALVYVNNRTRKSYPIVVGKRGGLSVKTPNAKSRRYVKGNCKKRTPSNSLFWKTVKQRQHKMTHNKKNK